MSRFIYRFSLCLLALVLGACAAGPASQAPTNPALTEVSTVAESDEVPIAPMATSIASIEMTDALGRQVAIPANIERVVSLAPSITEILYAVGAGSQVVADTSYCNYPAEADALPEIGGFSSQTISIESIVALNPDLVIGGSAEQIQVAESLAAVGIPTLIFDPKTFDDVYRNIGQIGVVTRHAGTASTVVAAMRQRIAAVQQKAAAISADQRPSVFYEVFDEPLLTAGPGTFIGQMLDLVGATNIFADATDDYPQVSTEAIVDRDPTVIVGPSSHGDKLTAELVAARPGWEKIRAVQDGRIYLLDGDMVSRPGPRLVDSLEDLAAALYPEQFR
ncbi:MAG: cobalamin-binding protein [Oscillochloris sp.]|nr:cobalamin-binding protein [Oscillochloris sp.]